MTATTAHAVWIAGFKICFNGWKKRLLSDQDPGGIPNSWLPSLGFAQSIDRCEIVFAANMFRVQRTLTTKTAFPAQEESAAGDNGFNRMIQTAVKISKVFNLFVVDKGADVQVNKFHSPIDEKKFTKRPN